MYATSTSSVTPAQIIPQLIFSGVLEQFPRLKCVFAEAGIGGARRAEVIAPDGMVLGLNLDRGERFDRCLEELTLPLCTGDLLFFSDEPSGRITKASRRIASWRRSA